MPTKLSLTTRPETRKGRVHIGLAFEFSSNDPQAARIYTGIGLLLREALSPDEQQEFLRQFKAAGERLKRKSA